MKAKHLIPLALSVLLAACTSGGNNQQQTSQTADTAKQAAAPEQTQTTAPEQTQQDAAPEPKKEEPKEDVAQNVLKLIDKKLLQLDQNEFSLTTAEYNQATTEKREFDEYTSPYFLSLMHQKECFFIANVKCYKMDEGDKYFVFFFTEAGCDGGATVLSRCYTYADNNLTPVENPITIPAFDEYVKGVNTAQYQELKWVKRDYPKPNKDLKGIDIRFDTDGNIELRPASTEISEELWDDIKPVKYKFDGKTLVKV